MQVRFVGGNVLFSLDFVDDARLPLPARLTRFLVMRVDTTEDGTVTRSTVWEIVVEGEPSVVRTVEFGKAPAGYRTVVPVHGEPVQLDFTDAEYVAQAYVARAAFGPGHVRFRCSHEDQPQCVDTTPWNFTKWLFEQRQRESQGESLIGGQHEEPAQ